MPTLTSAAKILPADPILPVAPSLPADPILPVTPSLSADPILPTGKVLSSCKILPNGQTLSNGKVPSLSRRFLRDFLRCGLLGWCMEILFTSLGSLRRRDLRLLGTTSVWMFPIYGSAALLRPVSRLLKNAPAWFRGLSYMSLIFSAEFLTGTFLEKHSLCPWNYRRSRWNVRQLIRLDYAPCWFAAGLLFERVLSAQNVSKL